MQKKIKPPSTWPIPSRQSNSSEAEWVGKYMGRPLFSLEGLYFEEKKREEEEGKVRKSEVTANLLLTKFEVVDRIINHQ